MESKSFTLSSSGGLLNVFITDLKVCEPGNIIIGSNTDKLPLFKGIWDTGATNSVITQNVVDSLKLQPIGITKVNGVHGEKTSPVFLVDFILPLGVIIQSLRVTLGKLPDNTDALIGMDVITVGDMSVTNLNGNTVMSFRIPSMHEVDYVKDSNRSQYTRHERRAMERNQKKEEKKNRGNK